MSFDDDWGHEARPATMAIMAWRWDSGKNKLQYVLTGKTSVVMLAHMSTESQSFPMPRRIQNCEKRRFGTLARDNRHLPNLSKKIQTVFPQQIDPPCP